jgi:hypothetical protein
MLHAVMSHQTLPLLVVGQALDDELPAVAGKAACLAGFR